MARIPNATGIPYNVTKDPQCRHSEKQGFVSWTIGTGGGLTTARAECSNCNSVGAVVSAPTATLNLPLLKEEARNMLMLVEAEPLVP